MKKGIVIAMSVLMMSLTACSSGSSSATNTAETSKNENSVYSDDMIDIYYVKMSEELTGNCFITIKVKNKTDKHITVLPTDSYINDSAVTLGSGVPTEMDAGKDKTNALFGAYTNVGIESFDAITKIETKFSVMDENMAELETTPTVTFTK